MTRNGTSQVLQRRERIINLRLEKQEERRKDHADNLARRSEVLTLEAMRGEEIIAPPANEPRPMRRQSGLDWLWSKRRITETQQSAGLRYGDEYRLLNDVSIPSMLRDNTGGGDPTYRMEARQILRDRVAKARQALGGHEQMTMLVDRVCGEGMRLRAMTDGDDAKAAKLEAVLLVALDLLAIHYGMIKR